MRFGKKKPAPLTIEEKLVKRGFKVRAVLGREADILISLPKSEEWISVAEAKELRAWLARAISAVEDYTP